MLTTVPPAQRRAAKQQLLADLQDGYSVQETQARAVIPCHPATIYRLRQRLQADPVTALEDGRHGHPVKLRGEVRDWLLAFCQETPHTPSHVVQAALQEHFGLLVSISQLNRFRAAHGTQQPKAGEKSRQQTRPRCHRLSQRGRRVQGACSSWPPPTRRG